MAHIKPITCTNAVQQARGCEDTVAVCRACCAQASPYFLHPANNLLKPISEDITDIGTICTRPLFYFPLLPCLNLLNGNPNQ